MNSARTIPLTLDEIAEAQALAARNVTIEGIAEALSTTPQAVEDALAGRVGAHAQFYTDVQPPALRRVALSPSDIQKIGRLAACGTPLADIAAEFNVTAAKADWAVQEYRRGTALAQARRHFARDRALTDEIQRREVENAPPIDIETNMRDLLRMPPKVRKEN